MYRTETAFASLEVPQYLKGFRDVEKFIVFCRQCGRYGTCWACPPYEFDTGAYLSGYCTAWVIGTKIIPDDAVREECARIGNTVEVGREVLRLARRGIDAHLLAMETEYPGSRAFFAGTCMLCPEEGCTRAEGRPCIHPGQVRHSLEAFGLDMGRTASELLGIEMKWSRHGELPEYFTLVSGFFTNCPIETPDWEK